jgi:isopentenyldiphosphate isomerase
MHPIVRVIIFDANRILMYKRPDDDFVAPNMWDTSISKHVRVGDDLPKRIKSVLINRYGMASVKTSFLANYTYEAENEEQFVALYVGCTSHKESKPTENGAKWWTLRQIEENLQESIFSPQFQIEYNILKRSGLIDNGAYDDCDCTLKELVNRKKSEEKLSEDY